MISTLIFFLKDYGINHFFFFFAQNKTVDVGFYQEIFDVLLKTWAEPYFFKKEKKKRIIIRKIWCQEFFLFQNENNGKYNNDKESKNLNKKRQNSPQQLGYMKIIRHMAQKYFILF